jgi:hypothetical protein
MYKIKKKACEDIDGIMIIRNYLKRDYFSNFENGWGTKHNYRPRGDTIKWVLKLFELPHCR